MWSHAGSNLSSATNCQQMMTSSIYRMGQMAVPDLGLGVKEMIYKVLSQWNVILALDVEGTEAQAELMQALTPPLPEISCHQKIVKLKNAYMYMEVSKLSQRSSLSPLSLP